MMTDLRQAAQQALEALESGHFADPIFAGETITLLQAALEQPEQEQTMFCLTCNKYVTQGCFAPNCRPQWREIP